MYVYIIFFLVNNNNSKVETTLSKPQANGDPKKPEVICLEVLERSVEKGKGPYSAYKKAMIVEEIIYMLGTGLTTSTLRIPKVRADVLACPRGNFPVLFIRESAVEGNTNCYSILEAEKIESVKYISFLYEVCIN